MIGSLIGGGLKVAGGIFGGIKASKAMKKVRKNLQQQQQENQDWYNRRYNEDGTQRADAQRLITMVNDSIKNRNKQAAGVAAVMGGSEESVALAKDANNQALTDTVSQVAAQSDARKDAIEQQYLGTKANLNAQLNDLQQKKASAISQAVQGVASAGAGIAENL